MDHNCIYLSGWCQKAGVREGKFGPSGWALMSVQQIKGTDFEIPQHNVFLGFNLGSDDPARTAKNRKAFEDIEAGGFPTVWDASIDSYVKRNETKVNRSIKASMSRYMITKNAGTPVNLCAFVGKVIQQPNEEWCEIHTTHRPGPKAKQGDPWPHNSVKVYLPGGRIKVKVGHQYYIAGKLAGKSPAGNDDLIVIATVANGT